MNVGDLVKYGTSTGTAIGVIIKIKPTGWNHRDPDCQVFWNTGEIDWQCSKWLKRLGAL